MDARRWLVREEHLLTVPHFFRTVIYVAMYSIISWRASERDTLRSVQSKIAISIYMHVYIYVCVS